MRKWTIALLCLLQLAVIDAFPAVADSPTTLRVGLLPGEAALTVIRLNEPLRAHLEKKLGMPVELILGVDYAATGEALRFGRIDVAYLGPVTYVLGRQRAQLEPIAKPEHEHGPTFQALVIVPADSRVKTLADLKGSDIAFGDVASTSGHWVPRYMLDAAGLHSKVDYQPRYLGSHDAVAMAVQRKTVNGGGISEPIFRRLVATAKIDGNAVRVLAESEPIPEYVWTFRAGLDEDFRAKAREAFLTIDDPAALNVFKAKRFVPAVDSDYQVVRGWMAELKD